MDAFPGRATRAEAVDSAVSLITALGRTEEEDASGEGGPTEGEGKPAVRGDRRNWQGFMTRQWVYMRFREAAYELQDERLDWPEFIEAIRAAYPDRELDSRAEPMLRRIWERKSIRRPEPPK